MYSRINVASYMVCWWFVDQNPSLLNNPWVRRILENCLPDWAAWKAQDTMVSVDQQTEEIKDQWKKEDNDKIVMEAQKEFPDAKVSLQSEDTGAVLIEHPANGSLAQSLLGGAMEIRSPWLINADSKEGQ